MKINEYLKKILFIINENNPSNKEYIDCFFTWGVWVGGDLYSHSFNEIRYGIVNCTGTGL